MPGRWGLDNLAAAAAVSVVDNPALQSIGLPGLADAGAELRVEGNGSLFALGFGALTSAESVFFVDNAASPVCAVEAGRLLGNDKRWLAPMGADDDAGASASGGAWRRRGPFAGRGGLAL